jgi:hypothetical protein
MDYKDIEKKLNEHQDWTVTKKSDDGRVNSQDSEEEFCKKINQIITPKKYKTKNREEYDLYLINGEDLKIVENGNFTNTLSFTKLASMLNLKGNNNKSIANSYRKQKECGGLKFVKDYTIIYFCKSTKKFTVCSLTELPLDCIVVNPSNGIQTKIPNKTVVRSDFEKFELIHKLFIEYINKRILNPAKEWETLING